MNYEPLPFTRTTLASEPAAPQQSGFDPLVRGGVAQASAAEEAPYSGIAFLRTCQTTSRLQANAPMQAKNLLRDSHLAAPKLSAREIGRSEPGVGQLRLMPGRVIQMDTAITHQTGKLKVGAGEYTVGLGMNATLDPDDPVVGSATGPNWDWMKSLRGSYPNAGVVRGHLLNHDLGGYAVPENLYPISTKANADHSANVEQKVKAALTAAHGKSAPKPKITYNVTVKQGDDPPETAAFLCDWKDETGKSYKYPVKSDLNNDSGGWGGRGGNTSPASWQHKTRRGPMDWAQQVASRAPKITVTGTTGSVGQETAYDAFVQAVLNAFEIEEDIDDLETVAAVVSKIKPEKVKAALEELGFTVKVKE